jgi:hypothetical protein
MISTSSSRSPTSGGEALDYVSQTEDQLKLITAKRS